MGTTPEDNGQALPKLWWVDYRKKNKGATHRVTPRLAGAGERNRTSDLRVTSALLYQLSYSSKIRAIIGDRAFILNPL